MTSTTISFLEYQQIRKKAIDQTLHSFFPDESLNNPLTQAAHYALFSKGKRIRPLLTLIILDTFQKDYRKALNIAAVVEMIHTYSLIHDDLPCMDDDDFRRGQKTVHKAFDEATAVLTGDFLLTYSFEILSKDENLNADQKITCIKLLSEAIGANGMILGQMKDIKNHDRHSLEKIKVVLLEED